MIPLMHPSDTRLEEIARKVVWWEPAEITLADKNDFLCRVMARAVWRDVQYVEKSFGDSAFREALRHCRPGVMDPASWHYWHFRLRMDPVPEAPKRTFA